MPETPILPLLKTVFESILEVFLLCFAGYVLARRGVVDRKTQKQLNRLNVSLFTPALLFSKVAFFLSREKLRELWIIPIFFVVTTCLSMAVAYVLGLLVRLQKSQRNFAMAAAMFMNSNSLPIALMQSLVITVPGLKWGDDDNKDAMVGRALTYLVLYSTFGMVVRWSYGVRLLSSADPESSDHSHGDLESSSDEEEFSPSLREQGVLRNEPSSFSIRTDDTKTAGVTTAVETVDHPDAEPNKSFYSLPNSPHRSVQDLPPVPSTSSTPTEYEDEDEDDEPLPARRYATEPTSTLWQSRRRRLRRRASKAWKTFYEFMTVPLWAALASLVVACTPSMQHALDQHVQPIKGALRMAGNCSIPLTLVVLGAYFYTPPDLEDASAEANARSRRSLPSFAAHSRSPSRASRASIFDNVREMFSMKQRSDRSAVSTAKSANRPGETKTVVVAVLSRMVITPILLFPMMAFMTKFNVQEVFDDPVFVVANALLIASPPALTLAQITQAASGDAFERLISRTIFWSYTVVTPPSTIIVVVVGLLLSKQ